MKRRSTLRDVASEAGVAVSTVSGILNNRSDSWASATTRERVINAASKLNFTPNKLARGLRMNRHNLIFSLLPDLTNPFFAGLARHLRIALESKSFELMAEETGFKKQRESEILEGLPSRYIDGFFPVFGDIANHQDYLKKLSQQLPIVVLGQCPDSFGLDAVGSDLNHGYQEAFAHLGELGHRKIGFVDSLLGFADPISRNELCLSLVQKFGFTTKEEWWVHCSLNTGHIRSSVQSWAKRLPVNDRPTALFCTNDLTAIAVMRGLQDADISIPDQISVIGIDNIEIGELLTCPLTTISQLSETIAQMAAEILLGRITGQRIGPPSQILLPTRLLIRSSTGPAPAPSKL